MMQRIKMIGLLGALAMALAGCTSTEQTLQPIPGDQSAPAGNAGSVPLGATDPFPPSASPAGAPQATPQQPSPAQAQAALPAGQVRGQIRFMPVIGAPVNAVTPLSRQLAVEARNRGLAILSASDPGGDHVLKGYFSADNFDGQTTVYYVWDILDPAGTRLTRVQGQETFAGAPGNPWASVPADVMQRIATRTLSDYVAWRGL
ncbi:MAG: hypothetical protein COA37_10975 [Hoeflea sp.]|uniref:hypothetical protein n=1 Tax=Hoeflea sp. TaxID=1940281 RepID=UPI000C0F25B8|nr:hypothetical protein [Hoeflea sp.]PHR22715.1 MAG: hypothetical protein COA37_10975 [Hoeflea sp.]